LTAAIDAALRSNVALLLAHGADPNLKTGEKDETALHHAALGSDTGNISLLQEHGAQIDSQDSAGLTPLMYAARTCSYWNIQSLLDAGAQRHAAAANGHTALDLAQRDMTLSYDPPNCERTRERLRLHNENEQENLIERQ